MPNEIELSGFNEMLARLESMGNQIAGPVEDAALKAGAAPLADAMRSNVHYAPLYGKRRGEKHIRDDIRISSVKIDKETLMKFVAVGPGKSTNWRAKFLEYGTSQSPAYPFVYPAVVETKAEVFGAMAAVIREALLE